jgi:drug/metabolite transporter (DMT)-like permease
MITPPQVLAWVMVVGLVIVGPLAAIQGVPASLGGGRGVWLAISGAGNVGGLLLAYGATRVGQLVLIAPLLATEGAIAAVIALTGGEAIAPGVGVTLVAIVAGICLAVAAPTDRSIAPRERSSNGAVLAIGAACAFGLSLYATGKAGSQLPTAWVVLSARVIGTVTFTVPLAAAGRLRLTRKVAPLVAISGVCEVLGFYAYTAGARHGIAIAAVLSSQFGALAAVAGYFLFAERLTRLQVVGVATVVAGVAVLTALRS